MPTEIPARLVRRLRAVAVASLSNGPVNLSDVATKTGIPRSTLYYNFKGSGQLTRWFVDELMKDLGRDVAAAVEAHDDAPSKLRAGIATTTSLAGEQPALTLALLRGIFTGDDLNQRLRLVRETVFPSIGEVLERGIADGSFVDVDVEETIVAFIGVIALVSLYHLGELGPENPVPHPNGIVNLMLEGLLNVDARSVKRRRAPQESLASDGLMHSR